MAAALFAQIWAGINLNRSLELVVSANSH